jgi:hypothetical protein
VRLRNQKNTQSTLGLSTPAWRELLKLALSNGWQPMGSAQPEFPAMGALHSGSLAYHWEDEKPWWERPVNALLPEALLDSYLPVLPEEDSRAANSRLVLLEDALNFVDALDRAYQSYEPVRVPTSYFLFQPDDPALALRPSLGALAATITVCGQGSFSIEPWRFRA